MSDWLTALHELNRRGEPAVLVTVVQTRGSTPREPGAKMVVSEKAVHDTIGGGQVEHAGIESARLLLEEGGDYVNTVESHKLSPLLGQCCGGVVTLLLERIPGGPRAWLGELMEARRGQTAMVLATRLGRDEKYVLDPADTPAAGSLDGRVRAMVEQVGQSAKPLFDRKAGWFVDPVPAVDFNIVLFGAGHVGTALVGVLATLPCEITWVDSLADRFPESLPANVRTRTVRVPESVVDECAPGAFYLVTTHSHPIDLAVCERVLERGDFAYLGLIGSKSKRMNFEKRWRAKGITQAALNRLTCPIGIDGISGKRPEVIAVAVAAQVLRAWEAAQRGKEDEREPASRELG
ncbi:MAG: xanthine dehydrogenase accessory protein XdhC [Arenicellales bacterium]